MNWLGEIKSLTTTAKATFFSDRQPGYKRNNQNYLFL
jgi:hypothetical protein